MVHIKNMLCQRFGGNSVVRGFSMNVLNDGEEGCILRLGMHLGETAENRPFKSLAKLKHRLDRVLVECAAVIAKQCAERLLRTLFGIVCYKSAFQAPSVPNVQWFC